MSIVSIISLYIISFILLFLDFVKCKGKGVVFGGFILILILEAGFKDEYTSSDTNNYVIAYLNAPTIDKWTNISSFFYEPGYSFFQSLFKTFFPNDPTCFFLFIATLSIICYSSIIWKHSKMPFFSLFIYISFFYLTREIIVIRYGLSSALMLVALTHFIQNNKTKFIFFSTIAFLFHYTALSVLLLLCIYIIPKRKREKTLEFVVTLSFVLYFVHITILNIIIFITPFLPDFFSYAVNKGLRYLDSESSYGIKQILPLIPYCYILHKRQILKGIKDYYCILLFTLFLMLQLNQAVTLARIGQMYLVIIVILIPFVIKSAYRNKYAIISYSIIYCLYTFIRTTFFNTGGFINVY